MRRTFHHRAARRGQSHQTGAHPQRPARGQPRSTAAPHRPRQNKHVPVGVFVQAAPCRIGLVDKPGRWRPHTLCRGAARGQADIGNCHASAMGGALGQQMAAFQAMEADRQIGAERGGADDAAAVRTQSRRDINRNDARPRLDIPPTVARPRPRAARGAIRHIRRETIGQGAGQPGTEQRIHDQTRGRSPLRRVDGPHGPDFSPAVMCMAGIGRQAARIAPQAHIDLPAARGQQARDDKAIAPIVARPAKHLRMLRRGGERGPLTEDRAKNTVARALHQLQPGNAPGGDFRPLDGAHLGRCQKISHAARSQSFLTAHIFIMSPILTPFPPDALLSCDPRTLPQLYPARDHGLTAWQEGRAGSRPS